MCQEILDFLNKKRKIKIKSEQNMFDFGVELGKNFRGGEVVGLIGNLGAGKTTLSKGIAQGLNFKKNVNSPTFVLMKIYPIKNHQTIKHLCHIDAYRIKSEKDLEAIGVWDYFDRDDTVSVVEWANMVKGFLPAKTLFLKITHKIDKEREVEIQ